MMKSGVVQKREDESRDISACLTKQSKQSGEPFWKRCQHFAAVCIYMAILTFIRCFSSFLFIANRPEGKTEEREGGREGGRERERDRDRQTDRQTYRQTETEIERQRETETQRQTKRQR